MAHLIHKEHEARTKLKKHFGVNVPKPKHKQVLEAKEVEEAKCNMTAEGTKCPVHGMAECMTAKKINEADLEENTFKYHMSKAIEAHKRGDDTKRKYHLDNAKTARYSIPTKDYPKHKDLFDKYKQMTTEETLDEVITKKTSAGEIIKDFQQSKNPKFAGKSSEKRRQMALGAYYSKHPEKSKTNEELSDDEFKKDIENVKSGKSDPNKMVEKWGQRGGAFYGFIKREPVKEDLAIPLLGSHDSEESVDMVKTELRALANKAMHLVMAMPDGMHVEPWVQAKLAQAKEMVSSVHDYMIYGDHDKPEEDEQTAPYDGGIDMGGSPRNTFPGMNVDNALGMNV
jgi:hypothetical protein